MTVLPFELYEDILRRLPVKSVKRFRCVAKAWCYTIDCKSFKKMHLQHTLASNSHRRLIIGGLGAYSVDLDSLAKAFVIKTPFYYKSVDGLSNSVNGLVLVMGDPAVLWNPYSAEYRFLPDVSSGNKGPLDSYSKITYGFGYDSKNDDYKVVRFVDYRHNDTHLLTSVVSEIYSLRSNSWKKISKFPYPLPFLRGFWRVHVNGALHTLVERFKSAKIMAFSLETEEHYEVPMLDGLQIWNVNLTLDVIEGCLCLVCVTKARVSIWVMKEYGVKESWSRLLSISRTAVTQIGDIVKPLVYSADGKRILMNCDDKWLVWCDLTSKVVEIVNVDGLPYVFYAEPCIESLISLDCPIDVKKPIPLSCPGEVKKKGPKKKMIRNQRDDFLSEGFKLVL